MPAQNNLHDILESDALEVVYAASCIQTDYGHPYLGIHHWLLALIETRGPSIAYLLRESVNLVEASLLENLERGSIGEPIDVPTIVSEATLLAEACEDSMVTADDIAFVISSLWDHDLSLKPPDVPCPGSPEDPPQGSVAMLEQFGINLTEKALQGQLSPVVGRDDEVRLVIETLCRRTKRNPVLVGPAGCGKTAIVEGLAQRIAQGDIPEMLQGTNIYAIQPSALVAGTAWGDLEKRIKTIIAEASHKGIILFIDEVHSIIGAGGHTGTTDIASLLKPALARGDLACIAATTDDEYRRFIQTDTALERRFQPVRIQEMSAEKSFMVMQAHRDDLARLRNVQVSDEVLHWLIDFASLFLKNRTFPDKGVDLVEQCVAYAVTERKSSVGLEDAELVAQRMVGMPLAVDERIELLRCQLSERALLTSEDVAMLLDRLSFTMSGLDLRPSRPNAVVLLIGDMVGNSERLAETIAESLFGGADRVVTIDFGQFTDNESMTYLTGAPPGMVGYGDQLPIHRILQMPWCVVRCESIHMCHPVIRNVLRQALADGVILDSSGKRIYLSDTVVILTAGIEAQASARVGFLCNDEPNGNSLRREIEKQLDPELVDEIDLIFQNTVSKDEASRRWLEQCLLSSLAERYRKHDIHLQCDESLIRWLLAQRELVNDQRDWERLVEERLNPLLVPYVRGSKCQSPMCLKISYEADSIHITLSETAP